MAIIHVNMLAGRSAEVKAELASRITEAACQVLQTKPESVRVLLQEYAEGEWFVAGKPLSAAPSPTRR
jgi:4-oxalocrotonate tautomerase family enzyme